MPRPLLLDLFCGAGGAAMGYHRAGFDVVGVDIKPQPNYPFEFHQGDALERLDWLLNAERRRFDAIHASPICKRHSVATPVWARAGHPNQIPPTRDALQRQPLPWVIENVPGAPLRPDFKICGCMTGLHELERERWFETNWATAELRSPCHHATSPITVAGHGEPSGPRMAHGLIAHKVDWERAMGIDWMTRDELAQAIPPAYTEHIGRQLLDELEDRGMITWLVICVVLVVAIATLAIGTHRSRQHPGSHRETEHEGWDDESIATLHGTLPATEQTIMAAPVDGHPPWDTAPWAAGWAPDPETAVLIHEAERDHRREQAWPASGNGHVTVAEPLAPLPPEPKPEPPVASVTSTPNCASPWPPPSAASLTTSETSLATPEPPTADALTLLDERQQLIDHAAAVIAAAKFDRILGGVMADA